MVFLTNVVGVFLLVGNSLSFGPVLLSRSSTSSNFKPNGRFLPNQHSNPRNDGVGRRVLIDPLTVDSSTAPRRSRQFSSFSIDKDEEEQDTSNTLPKHQLLNSAIAKNNNKHQHVRAVTRQKYNRKRIPESEKKIKHLRQQRQAAYDRMVKNTNGRPVSIWGFESLFPNPVYDEESIREDLYEGKEREQKRGAGRRRENKDASGAGVASSAENRNKRNRKSPFHLNQHIKMRSSWFGGNAMMRIWREPRQHSGLPSLIMATESVDSTTAAPVSSFQKSDAEAAQPVLVPINDQIANVTLKVDRQLTRMVEDRVYGYRRLQTGKFIYETSLMGDGAVRFREGVRLGNPLRINADRLNYLAKKEMQHGRVEEASELYEQAASIDPRDGRAYLGLSRCAERRRDFELARKWLQTGLTNSVSLVGDQPDRGDNPFLLQALGCLEEKMGNLATAEALYMSAAHSRPSHAAAWVALAQIRTRKLGQPVSAGRVCFQTAERELASAGLPPSSFVYTAWAALERKAGDNRTARKLFKKAIDVDPKCSAAWLQLGVLEADSDNWDEAEKCFTTVLKFDQRNSRVLQAYALAETKRPKGNSRQAIELFERALKVNPRDAGVLQAYALYVAELGDIKSARSLLERGTQVDKRHAAVWQAWGVFETRQGNAEKARKIFQEGIWACGQLTGNQSGGYGCARLWQAWGVLEAQCKDYAAARRCFSRALDANSRNVAVITAWALMEEELGNTHDAKMIFERALKNFAAGSNDKMSLWRSYELMEQRIGDVDAAKSVYQRAMRETMNMKDEEQDPIQSSLASNTQTDTIPSLNEVLFNANGSSKSKNEVEVSRWESSGGEVWMNDRAIETKINLRNRKKK